MSNDKTIEVPSDSRRKFLAKTATATAVIATGGASAALKHIDATNISGKGQPLPIPGTNKVLGMPVTSSPYGMPSKFEAHVVRKALAWLSPNLTSTVSFTPMQDLHGIITPSGLHFERFHAGYVDVNPDTHLLAIHGLVERPIKLTMQDLKRLPSTTAIHFLECPANGALEWRGVQVESAQYTHGMASCSEWTGVKLTTIMEMVGVKPEATWFYAEGADGSGLQRSVPLPGAKDQFGKDLPEYDQNEIFKDVIIAYAQNGEALRPENGYPVRLVVPGCEANMSIKYLRRLKFTNKPLVTYQETRHYTDMLKTGKVRQFSHINEANSIITYPSPDHPMNKKGYREIRGLAWSGKGKVKHVDISVDGGKNWKEAKLMTPVLSKSFTRFTMDWDWDGTSMIIMSRVTDETGYVQPTLLQLREARGTNGIYHKNAIQAWEINHEGALKNVHIENI
jgi:sulfane dehydrogenase subunit SoxC